jgi:hypothetical protein
MAGKDMLDYIDIAKSAPERHPDILDFVQSLLDDSMIHLTPQDWFFKGHVITGGYRDLRGMWIPHHAPNGRCYLWALPPVIADVALEEAMKAIHKRTDATHVFIIPRLCTPIWRRWLHKMADFYWVIPAGSKCWPSSLHEPLFFVFGHIISTHQVPALDYLRNATAGGIGPGTARSALFR